MQSNEEFAERCEAVRCENCAFFSENDGKCYNLDSWTFGAEVKPCSWCSDYVERKEEKPP